MSWWYLGGTLVVSRLCPWRGVGGGVGGGACGGGGGRGAFGFVGFILSNIIEDKISLTYSMGLSNDIMYRNIIR